MTLLRTYSPNLFLSGLTLLLLQSLAAAPALAQEQAPAAHAKAEKKAHAAASKRALHPSTKLYASPAVTLQGYSDGAASHTTAPVSPEEATNIRVYKLCNRAVVNINTITQNEDMFFNVVPSEGLGSGCIITGDGVILTNLHVINKATAVKVTLFDGSVYPAQLIGDDPANDIAVIKINVPPNKKLTTIAFGDSGTLEVGRRVFAIGNPFGYDRTLTAGIVSSLGRTLKTQNGARLIKDVIQTDAAINPGNSGGPLLDSSGKMVGITTAIFSVPGVQQSSGIGLAVPINTVKRIVPELIAHHGIARVDIGILAVQPIDAGLRIVRLDPQGVAARAGLQGPKLVTYQQGAFNFQSLDQSVADIVIKIDDVATHTVDELLSYLDQKKPGQVVTLTVLRSGKSVKIPVKLTVVSPA